MTPQAQGHLSMLLFSVLVAGSFSLGSLIANEIAPMALTALRFAIAAGIMGALALATTGIPRRTFDAPWRYLVLGGLYVIYFVLMFEGLKTAPPVSASAVFTLTPIMAGVIGWLLLRQVTTSRMALALAIGAIGALWVIFRADWAAVRAFDVGRGEAIFFWGCVAHAAYPPVMRLLSRQEPAAAFTFAVIAAGCLILMVVGWTDIRSTDWAGLRPLVWITIAYLSFFATAGTFLLVRIAAVRLPSAKVMAYTYLTPSWVILWEIALGNGAPGGLVLVGVALTVIALLLLLRDEH
ncbi:DMT family transporter [Sedimentitalea sp. XS_ASV28]|uniref:DMT family transporter n=1 Tax=Sedimentitalea sp. XS_ASV28 TaxID=3241296 RepID=UPI0035162582